MTQLKAATTLACWTLFISGVISLSFGIFTRFVHFEEFKLWIGSMALGAIALTLTGVIALLRSYLD